MEFLNRQRESSRLNQLARSASGGLVVVYGRRRLGKTRLLLEWTRRHGGIYTVADQSAAQVQRRYFCQAIAARLPGFADAEFADWRALLSRLARDAAAARFRGPVVIDELPYLVNASPELPSVLQQWLDHEARDARLVVAVAGSSQRMMQGLVLSRDAPLYGRAQQILQVNPLGPEWLDAALGPRNAIEATEMWTAWGGVPRYWELAADETGSVTHRVERLVLDPMGALHHEPDRLLLEELPPAADLRPILDAIGAGAHRVSEIGARIGRAATSLSHPLARLIEMGVVCREVPFGEPEKGGKRALYRLACPFVRMWFRVVAPNRGMLATAVPGARAALLAKQWPRLAGEAWEELVRTAIPQLDRNLGRGRPGAWGTAGRWWWRTEPEWDVVARSQDGHSLLLGEARYSARPFSPPDLIRAAREVTSRPLPAALDRGTSVVRALFVPAVQRRVTLAGVTLVTGDEILRRE